jgi:hypothetical protein
MGGNKIKKEVDKIRRENSKKEEERKNGVGREGK